MKPVISSHVSGTDYDAKERVLTVEFSNGQVCRYYGVPGYVNEQLNSSESFGKAFAALVKGKFEYTTGV